MTFGLKQITFAYRNSSPLLVDATLEFTSSEKVALLVPSGGGKTTILDLLAGRLTPAAGTATLPRKASWPIGTASIFHPALSPEANIRLSCAMMGVEAISTTAWVADFAMLGSRFYKPLSQCSAGERARLAYAFSYSIDRSFFVAEDSPVTGDSGFMSKCNVALARRLNANSIKSGMLLITRNTRLASHWGSRYAVLDRGKIVEHLDANAAKSHFEEVEDRFQRFEIVVPSHLEVG